MAPQQQPYSISRFLGGEFLAYYVHQTLLSCVRVLHCSFMPARVHLPARNGVNEVKFLPKKW